MSLVASRLSLTHRVTVERNAGADSGDGWGQGTDWQPHLTDLPCRAWTTTGQETVDGTNVVLIENLRVLLPEDTDVTERDRIATVTFRGQTIVDGPVDIRAVLPRQGVLGAGFLELVLVQAG